MSEKFIRLSNLLREWIKERDFSSNFPLSFPSEVFQDFLIRKQEEGFSIICDIEDFTFIPKKGVIKRIKNEEQR